MNRYWLLVTFIIGVTVGLLIPSGSHGQVPGRMCTDREDAGKQLARRHSEASIAIGLASNGSVIEVFAKQDGSSWTILLTNPKGISCMVAAGESWEDIPFDLGQGT